MEDGSYLDEEGFAKDITQDLLAVLSQDRFFDRLDDLFCPTDPSIEPAHCGDAFERSTNILAELGFNPIEIEEITAVLRANGACCDCEVLYNVAEENRLKAKYWKSRAAEVVAGWSQEPQPAGAPPTWPEILAELDEAELPEQFMSDRRQGSVESREPL